MYKLHLILKYLRRRWIAWVALGAVMLCTTMVLVVISVMGGWLDMFENSARGLTGDVIVRSQGLSGFPYYQEMIQRIEQDPQVFAAVPTINTYGLVNISNQKTTAVQVMGIPLDQIGKVNVLPESLYQQYTRYVDAGQKPPEPPTFDLRQRLDEPTKVALLEVPDDVPWINRRTGTIGNDQSPLWSKLHYDELGGELSFRGKMTEPEREKLLGLSTSKVWKSAVNLLANESNWPGMVAGSGVLDIHKGPDGKLEGREDFKYHTLWAKLTVLGVSPEQAMDEKNKSERQYWIVDESHTGMWQYDNDHVYVPFDILQTDLGMQAKPVTELIRVVEVRGDAEPMDLVKASNEGPYELQRFLGRLFTKIDVVNLKKGDLVGFRNDTQGHVIAVAGDKTTDLGRIPVDAVWKTQRQTTLPSRTTEISIKLKPGVDPLAARESIAKIVHEVIIAHPDIRPSDLPIVETWKQANSLFIGAIENEKLLVTFLFGIISIVAIFLIFCIFYMIVAEKTKDIGIIKSVGATSSGVAGIFLGYGLIIGIVGAALGLVASYLIVHYINQIHNWLGRAFHVVIWNPRVYAFDKIPNTMQPREAAIILSVAVVASVLGALVPAIVAARMNPVEALRWE